MSVTIERAAGIDLAQILAWLEREYVEDDGEGFWCNRQIIRRAHDDDELWVLLEGDEAVAFQVGEYSPDITNVRKDRRRRGYGSALFEAGLARASRDDVNLLKVECNPRDSLAFWEKHEFVRYGDMSERGPITARRILERSFALDPALSAARVTISYFAESATWSEGVAPIAVHQAKGSREVDGSIRLDRRVMGLSADEPDGRDLVIRIEVDGRPICFCKAKYDEARRAGVLHDFRGGVYFIDIVNPVAP